MKESQRIIKWITTGLSSAYPRGRALLPFGTVVKSRRNGINSYTNSNELSAQYVQPQQRTNKRKGTTPGKRVPAWRINHAMCCCETTQAAAKRKVSGSSVPAHPSTPSSTTQQELTTLGTTAKELAESVRLIHQQQQLIIES